MRDAGVLLIVVTRLMEITAYVTWCLVYCAACFPLVTDTKRCYRNLRTNDSQPITVMLSNMTSQTGRVKYCILEVKSAPGKLLTLQIYYVPHNMSSLNCSRDYVHVGNDKLKIDKNTMTSYKYCMGTLEEEVVSRGNYLWVVFRMSLMPTVLKVKVKAQPPVKCSSSHFRCSPVQCVSTNTVCDGNIDCWNARDEFCKTKASNKKVTTPCFRCKDGTCINPEIPRYHTNWGVKLWYLCDGYSHCPDGTDERKDICYRMKGRLDSVFQCVPTDRKFGANASVLMWNTVLCNKKHDCFNGEDESLQHCPSNNKRTQLHMDASAICSVIAFLGFIIIMAVLLLYLEKRQRPSEREQETQSLPPIINRKLETCIILNTDPPFDAFGFRQTTI